MALTEYGPPKETTDLNKVKRVWHIVRNIKLSLEYLLVLMIIATFFLHLTRADVPILWYAAFLILISGYIFEKNKGLIIKEKDGDDRDRYNSITPRDGEG